MKEVIVHWGKKVLPCHSTLYSQKKTQQSVRQWSPFVNDNGQMSTKACNYKQINYYFVEILFIRASFTVQSYLTSLN